MGRHDFSVQCRNVDKETRPQDCIMEGKLPSWLRGEFVSNSFGVTKVGNTEYEHIFDSSALLQRFSLTNDKVQYSSKFLHSETFKTNKKAGKIIFSEFATPGSSNKSLLSRIIQVMENQCTNSDNTTNILKIGSRCYCQGHSPIYHEIDPKTLDVINKVDLFKICKINSQCPGIMKDKNGNFYSLCLTVTILGPKYALVKYPKDGNLAEGKIVVTFNCRWRMSPSLVHSAAMTENYLIFIETPLTISIMNAISELNSDAPATSHLKWHEDKNCVIRVIEVDTWKESSVNYVTDPFFHFNFYNVYEESGHLVVMFPAYKDFSFIKNLRIKALRDETKNDKNNYANFVEPIFPYLRRYVLPLDHSNANENRENLVTLPNTSCKAFKDANEIHLSHEVLGDVAYSSAPTRNFHPSFDRKSKFMFNHFASRSKEDNYLSVVKFNVDTKETLFFYEDDLYASKPVFVADPDGQEEDDGLLLSLYVRSSDPNYVGLLILSTKTMTEICRIHTKLKTSAVLSTQAIFVPNQVNNIYSS